MTNNESSRDAVVEALAGVTTGVEDPFVERFKPQQPSPRFAEFQRQLLDEPAEALGL